MKFLKLLFEARTIGMKITTSQNYKKCEREVIIAVILHLLSKGILFAEEIKAQGKGITEVVISSDENIVTAYKSETSETRIYENKEESMVELFSKIGFSEDFSTYQNKWMVKQASGYRVDVEDTKNANKYLKNIHPVVNEDGHLLLAEDNRYNTVWAYVVRHKNDGTLSYGVYKRNSDGRASKTTLIPPAAVSDIGTKVQTLIKNYEGTFNSKDALEASMKLWCWNLVKSYSVQSETDEYDQTDICEMLKDWIWENVGKKVSIGNSLHTEEPVYIKENKEGIDIGIWADSLGRVFRELEIEENPKIWLREAVKEHWIIPSLGADGTFVRNATNTSQHQREIFKRKNKNERFYKFAFKDEEKKQILKEYEERKEITLI